MTAGMQRLVSLFALLVVVVLAGASGRADGAAQAGRLQSFGSCGELLAYVKRQAGPLVGPWGLGGGVTGMPMPVAAGERDAARSATADYSGTNVQEEGVDEPDLVKSDGSHLFVVAGNRLRVVAARGRPRLVGSLALEPGLSHELLLAGSRLLVVSRGAGVVLPAPGAERTVWPYAPSRTLLTEVDIREPASPRIVRTLTVEADYLSARLAGHTARVVLQASMPREIDWESPVGSTRADLAAALARNRALVASSGVSSWLPSVRIAVRRTGAKREHALVQCRHVQRPPSFSGLGLLTVLTIDLASGLDPVDSDAVMTDGRVVYASPENLVVATERWADRPQTARPSAAPESVKTALHVFDIADSRRTRYRASGEVPGFLLNQWSLSEHRGVLRVATTELPPWIGGEQTESESFVTVLDVRAGRLVTLGRVGGLGRGERIYGVRFLGDVGYVVTFRQIDPLYTLDLANPRRPALLGELKIPGYSAYLHPLAGDLVLGLGQDATGEGRAVGTQLSLFDVSDLRRPVRLHRLTIAKGSSEAEYDHHAFLHWPPARLAVVPLSSYDDSPFVGAVGFRIGREGIQEVGRISHSGGGAKRLDGSGMIRRAVVVGDTLFTVSDHGVEASSLGTLAQRAWIRF
jgi:Beta propeller domain